MSSKRKGAARTGSAAAAAEAGPGRVGSVHPARVEEIELRAYEIYLERSEQPGRELDDWLEAERQLKANLS